MSPEDYRQLNQLFLAALELPPEQREAFLAQTCGHDTELRRGVEAMLAADADPWRLIDQPAHSAAAELFINDSSELPNEGRLGHYRLTHEIGRGGMGAVYAAVRDDDQYRQKVAIKLVKADLADLAGRGAGAESALQRFRLERQILARLEHPNIARLLDGGATSDGT